jgi:DNA-binding response OmpR family regulator
MTGPSPKRVDSKSDTGARRILLFPARDVIMPGLSGPEVVARIRKSRPQIAVLYMSGYDHDLIDKKSLEATAGFIPKPFSPRALLSRVDELLRGNGQEEQGNVQCGS